MSSGKTSSTGYPSIGGSSIESGVSLPSNADGFLSSTRSQVGQTHARANTPRRFFCTYHEETGHSTIWFGRKAEGKNHMNKFHSLVKEWKCPACQTIFDRDTDYERHYRDEHAEQPVFRATDVVTNLLPKQVFACGFRRCENLFSLWSDWFDHITAHMKDNKKPSDWSYTVVIRNLLRQPDLRDPWERMMLHRYGTTQYALHWDPSSARQLCQKLECRDFRPGINFVVEAANMLGRLALDQSTREIMQIRLETPSCDSVPYYQDNEHLDRILMRPAPSAAASTPGVPDLSPQYYSDAFGGRQTPGNAFSFMGIQSVPSIPRSGQSHAEPYHSTTSAQAYEQTQAQQYSPFTPATFDEELQQASGRMDFGNGVQRSLVGDTAVLDGAPQPSHILQDLNYYDYDNYAKQSTQRRSFLRRVQSSMSLSSKKSQSSLDVDNTQAIPPVPPVPSNSTTPPARSRASSMSQRSKSTRKTGQAANQL